MARRCDSRGRKRKRHRTKKKPSHEKVKGALLRSEAFLDDMERETIERLRKDDQRAAEDAYYWADGEEWEEVE